MSCPVPEVLPHDPTPFWHDGQFNFAAHQVGWLISAFFSILAVATSLWLIIKHLSFFYNPSQQRHIVRILFLVLIYASCSLLSYIFYRKALFFQIVRDGYEGFVIASFFHLLLEYLSAPPPASTSPLQPAVATQKERAGYLHEAVKDVKLKKWMWPLGCLPSGSWSRGERFVWLMRVCIGQYVILRPVTTLMAVSAEAAGAYCLASWSPRFMHVYTAVIVSISVTVAMYALLQLYWPLRTQFKPFKPVLKFLAVKSVVFLTFWQETTLSFFITFGWIKDTEYWTAEEIVVGIAALLSCFEMMAFAFLHLKAFSYLPYRGLAPPVHPSAPSADLDDVEEAKQSAWKSDGTPLLQQTKRWAALWECVRLGDMLGELKDEAIFVAHKGHVAPNRSDDLKDAFDQNRPRPDQEAGYLTPLDPAEFLPPPRKAKTFRLGQMRSMFGHREKVEPHFYQIPRRDPDDLPVMKVDTVHPIRRHSFERPLPPGAGCPALRGFIYDVYDA